MNKASMLYENTKIFPTIYDLRDMDKLINSSFKTLLVGRVLNILSMKRIVQYLKENDKTVIVDIDLIGGLKPDDQALKYIVKEVKADGIITTHSEMIKHARDEQLITVLKIFTFDEFSTESAIKNISYCNPDIVEALPGIAVPCFIQTLKKKTDAIIAVSGYLGTNVNSIAQLLKCGVSGIHTGEQELWNPVLFK